MLFLGWHFLCQVRAGTKAQLLLGPVLKTQAKPGIAQVKGWICLTGVILLPSTLPSWTPPASETHLLALSAVLRWEPQETVQISAAALWPLGRVKRYWLCQEPWWAPWWWMHVIWGLEAGLATCSLSAPKGQFRKHLCPDDFDILTFQGQGQPCSSRKLPD